MPQLRPAPLLGRPAPRNGAVGKVDLVRQRIVSVPTGVCAVAAGLSRHAPHHPAQYEPASDRRFAKPNASAPARPATTSLIVAGGGPSHSRT